jgi:hypothetical protein
MQGIAFEKVNAQRSDQEGRQQKAKEKARPFFPALFSHTCILLREQSCTPSLFLLAFLAHLHSNPDPFLLKSVAVPLNPLRLAFLVSFTDHFFPTYPPANPITTGTIPVGVHLVLGRERGRGWTVAASTTGVSVVEAAVLGYLIAAPHDLQDTCTSRTMRGSQK